MIKRLFVLLILLVCSVGKAQCPQIFNSFGNLSTNPVFVHCTPTNYTLNFQSNTAFGAYTINWGDGTPDNTGASNPAFSVITHSYAATVNTFVITLTIPSAACSRTALVVMEQPVTAVAAPIGTVTSFCAPGTVTLTNLSTNVSPTTVFTWNFGDGTPPQTLNYTTGGQNITHTYAQGAGGQCNKPITLTASNYCRTVPSVHTQSINLYDVDIASITVDKLSTCWPDNTFQFLNTTQRNCLSEGNTSTRQQQWNFGNYWGFGHDSIIGFDPWPPTAPVTVAYPAMGTYTVSLSTSNSCGVSQVITTVSIVPPPTGSLVSPTGNICQNNPVTFTNSSTPGYTYLWDFGTGGGLVDLGPGNKTFTYTSPGTYTVKLVATIPNSSTICASTSTHAIIVLAAPVSSFSVSTSSGCGTLTNVTFTANSTGVSSWNWAFGNNNSSSQQNPPPQNYTVPGIITPSLTVTASSGCSITTVQTITLYPNPTPSFVPFVACLNAPVTFTNNSGPVSGTHSIITTTWDFGDLSSPTNSNSTAPVHTYSAAGIYTVQLTTASAFCSASLSQTVSVNVKPTAGFVATPTTGCPPLTVSFTNTSTNAANYLWKFLNTTSVVSTATDPTFAYTNSSQALQNYTVTLVASVSSCMDSIKKVISVFPKPIADFTMSPASGCSPLSTTFSNTSASAVSSTWLFGDGATSTITNSSHTYTNATALTISYNTTLVATNNLGCMDTLVKPVTVYPEAPTTFSMIPSNGCNPLLVNFVSIPGVASYAWDHGDSSPTYTTLTAHTWTYTNASNSNSLSIVSLTAETTNGCIGTATSTVTVFPAPEADFIAGPLSGCSPLSVTFTNTSSGHVSSKWNFNNGQTSLLQDPVTTFTSPAGSGLLVYSVKLVAANANNCKDSVVKTVTISPRPKAIISTSLSFCAPKTVTFTSGSTGSVFYEWDFGNNQTFSSSLTTVSHPFTTGSEQPFLIKLKVTSSDNCQDSTSTPVFIYPKPDFSITALPDSGCSPLPVRFNPITGADQYQWKFNGIIFSNQPDASNTFENKDAFRKNVTVQLIARDVHNCPDTATKQITVFPIPTAKFSARPLSVFIPNQATNFTNESSPQFIRSKWDFGDGELSEEYSPSHIYSRAGEFQPVLIVTSSEGCVDTFALPDKVIAYSESEVEIPTAFTPNPEGSPGPIYANDVNNDIFHPNIKGVESYEFSVYSRWGELLFVTKNPEEGWDGYYKGQICIQDVYIWKINASFINGRKYNKTGDILLLR